MRVRSEMFSKQDCVLQLAEMATELYVSHFSFLHESLGFYSFSQVYIFGFLKKKKTNECKQVFV